MKINLRCFPFLSLFPDPLSVALSVTAALVLSSVAWAGSEIFVCTDAAGTRTYQNTGPSDQCRKLNLDPVLSVPQPAPRARFSSGDAPPGGSAPSAPAAPARGATGSGSGAASPGFSGASVPREAQVNREQDRLRILENELREEERRLQALQQRQSASSEPKLAEDVARSQASLDSLRREIAKVRRP